jgi:cystathionine gamma-synthase
VRPVGASTIPARSITVSAIARPSRLAVKRRYPAWSRGARTLAVRLRQAQESAGELAPRLAAHPAVGRVRYPGLPDDPHSARAARQMRRFGAVLSFEVRDADTADAVCAHVQVIAHATGVGGVESTIERRVKLPGQDHVPAGLVRLSVGCEHVEDLWADLATALDARMVP